MAEATRAGVKGLRVPVEPAAVIDACGQGTSPLGARLTAWWAARLARIALAKDFVVPDAVFGLAWSGAMTADRVAALLNNLPDGTSEIYTHPATSAAFPGHAPGYRYEDELAALTSGEAIEAAKRSGAMRGGFAELSPLYMVP
jgi:hypothetical protein